MKPSILIELPTDPSYYGTDCDSELAMDICNSLERMIRSEFDQQVQLSFEFTYSPRGSGIHGDNEVLVESIHRWIQDNWTAAL